MGGYVNPSGGMSGAWTKLPSLPTAFGVSLAEVNTTKGATHFSAVFFA